MRLTPIGRAAGLVSDAQFEAFQSRKRSIEQEKERLENTYISKERATIFLEKHGKDGAKSGVSLADLLRRPDFSYEQISELDDNRPELSRSVVMTATTDIKYAGYEKRQLSEVEKRAKLEKKTLSPDIDYLSIKGLRIEAAQKLNAIKPLTIGQASGISGVSPADISVLLIYLSIN